MAPHRPPANARRLLFTRETALRYGAAQSWFITAARCMTHVVPACRQKDALLRASRRATPHRCDAAGACVTRSALTRTVPSISTIMHGYIDGVRPGENKKKERVACTRRVSTAERR